MDWGLELDSGVTHAVKTAKGQAAGQCHNSCNSYGYLPIHMNQIGE